MQRSLLQLARPIAVVFAMCAALCAPFLAGTARAQVQTPDEIGQWGPVLDWGVQAKHMVVLPTGEVLVWSTGEDARVWDASTDADFTPTPLSAGDIHCASQTLLGDGRVLVAGGQADETHQGTHVTALFDPFTKTWATGTDMNKARWYATLLALDDGRAVITTGDDENKERVLEPEIYDPIADTWTLLTGASRDDTLYTFMYQLPDGRIFQAGPKDRTWFLDVTGNGAWTEGPRNSYGASGYSVSSAMYRPGKILNSGGGDPAVTTATVIDMTATSPAWHDAAPMNFARRRHDLTIMADGSVLAVGGTGRADDDAYAVLEAERFDPDTETWTVMDAMDEARMYHSATVLLPDGRIVAGGGEGGERRKHAQIFSPPYLFKGSRPTITSAPESTGYGSTFAVTTPEAADIASVALLRPNGVTHTYDQSQRYIPLSFTASGDTLTIDAPANAFLAAPGYYMLFILNSSGVPAVAPFIRVAEGADLVPGSISGTVTSGGNPVAGATVSYPGGTTTTDALGNYSFSNVTSGTHTLTATAPTYASATKSVIVASAQNSIADFSLTLAGTVQGHVFAEATGLPIAGADVEYPGGSVTTDANGYYVITDVAEGLQTLKATAVAFEGQEDTVTVIAGNSVTLDFHLPPGHTVIEGEVLRADTLGPIEGATVSYPGGTPVVTDFAGFFELHDVPEGSHTVTASAPGFLDQSLPAEVITGFETTLDFALEPEGLPQDVYLSDQDAKVKSSSPDNNYGNEDTLRVRFESGGIVWQSYLQFNVTGLSSPPVSAKLRLFVTDGSPDGGTLYAITEPFDEDTITWSNAPACGGTPLGSFGAVADGTWAEIDLTSHVVSSAVYGFCIKNSVTNSAYFSSKEGASPPELVVDHQDGGGGGPDPTRITGTVSEASTGSPITGATVSYSGGSTQTDGTGSYTFDNVAPGTYTLTASALGYVLATDNVSVVAEQTATLDFSLLAAGGPQDVYLSEQDAKVKSSSPDNNYGGEDNLRVRLESNGDMWQSYLQFNVSGLTGSPQSATLRLHATDTTPDGGTVYPVGQVFDEDTITFANAPGCDGTPIASIGAIEQGDVVEVDVTAHVPGNGVYVFCMKSNDSNSGYYSSKEGLNPPELAIVAGEACTLDSECDDGLFCNGTETCVAGACVGGTTPDCNDGLSCTVDSCDETIDACVNMDICSCTSDLDCDDGQFCNGAEVCNAGICESGTPVVCDDGVSCTVDACDEGSDSCSFTPDDGACDDAVFCNGAEVCDTVAGCGPGAPPSCDDGIACTVDSCDTGTDACLNAADDARCDNGLFCDGSESCDPLAGCMESPTGPCGSQSCEEAFDVCLELAPAPVVAEIRTGLAEDTAAVQTGSALEAVDGDLYIAAVSPKPWRPVTSVSGLGLVWQQVVDQCGARSQTGVSVWAAQGTPTGPGPVAAMLTEAVEGVVITAARYATVADDAIGSIVRGNTLGVDGACSGGSDEGSWALSAPISAPGAAAFVAVAKRQRRHEPIGFDVHSDEVTGTGGDTAGLVIGDQVYAMGGGQAYLGGNFKGMVDWAAAVIEILPGDPEALDASLPPVPVPPENPITEAKRILGKILFWEQQLSSDDTVACGSCHLPFAGGADPRLGQHPGPDGVFGNDDDITGSPGVALADETNTPISHPYFGFDPQVTRRSAPVFIGAQFSQELFVDGAAGSQFRDPVSGDVRIASGGALESQVVRPPLGVVEMANQGRDWADVVAKIEAATPLALATNLPADVATRLASSPTYPDLFQDAFGDPAVTPDRLAFAIATYERTLVPDQTPWDAFMAGDTTALTASQQQGWDAFKVSLCATCHTPPLFTDNQFHNIGVRPPSEDTGRQEVTGLEEDRGKFRTPTLRDAALKHRFMHNGRLITMGQAVDFYLNDRGNQFLDNLSPLIPRVDIPVDDQLPLLDFLENALIDPRVANEEFPFDRPTLSTAP